MSNPTRNKVWLLIDSRQYGGIETHVAQLAAGLLAYGQTTQVLFLCHYDPPSPLCAKLESLSVPYQYLGHSTKQALFELCRLIQVEESVTLHAHGYKANLVAKMAKVSTGVRLLSTYHAGETPQGRMWLYDWLDRTSAFIANHVLVVSHAIGDKLWSHSLYFENFIDINDVEVTHGEQIAFVGRLSHEKAPKRFVALAEQFPTHRFHLYGTGDLATSLQQRASVNVSFHGHQNDMAAVWPNISLIVICSHYEGLPMVALEAMARGIIVISTNVGEMPKLIQHQQNGYIAHNELEIKQCFNDWISRSESEQTALRLKAIETIRQRYSQQVVIPKLLKLYSA